MTTPATHERRGHSGAGVHRRALAFSGGPDRHALIQ